MFQCALSRQLIWEHRELNKKARSTTKKLLALEEESKQRKEDGVDRCEGGWVDGG